MNLNAGFLHNIHGNVEIGRLLLTIAAFFAITMPIVFTAWDMYKGDHFDITAFCLAYPSGLGVLISSGVLSVGKKEKDIANAKQTVAQAPLSEDTSKIDL